MKKTITLLLILLFSVSCQKSTHQKVNLDYIQVIKEKNLSLSQNKALKYFFYTEGIDKYTNEPISETESDYFYTLQGSKEKFLHFETLKESNILQITDKYILVLLNPDQGYSTLAGTFKIDGTPINFLLLEKSFGTNEFSVQRVYKIVDEKTFMLSDERYDMEWLTYPTKGVKKLTSHNDIKVRINEKGFFQR